MKKLCIITLFFLITSSLFASHFDIIPPGDPVLDDLRFLSLESGSSFLSFIPPLSPHEVEQFLDSLDFFSLSNPGQEAYLRLKNRLTPVSRLTFLSSEIFSFTIDVNATLEARLRLNNDVSWYSLYPKVPALISVPVNVFFHDFLQLRIEPGYVVSSSAYFDMETFGANAAIDTEKYDHTLLSIRAYMAAGGSWWNFQIGRDRLSYGTGNTGSLTVSDNPDYYEFMRFSFFTNSFKYSSLIVQMPLDLRNLEISPPPGPENLLYTMNRYFYLHRLDFNLFNSLSIGIMEGVIAGNAPLELRYFNPFIIFHSLYSWRNYDPWESETSRNSMNGSILSFEVNWNFINSFSVYGQFVMNEFTTPKEFQSGVQPPNGLGFMAGLQYSHPFITWASRFFFEFVYTGPYLNLNPSPYASFIHMRYTYNSGPLYTFMGYPRDLVSFTTGGHFFRNDDLYLTAIISMIFNGEFGMEYNWENNMDAFNLNSPTGTAETKFITSLSARWKFNEFFTINGELTGIFSGNNNHMPGNEAGLQASLSATFSY